MKYKLCEHSSNGKIKYNNRKIGIWCNKIKYLIFESEKIKIYLISYKRLKIIFMIFY